jgi:bifunctional UDP-N-acetylglucosamine pyrophosphorylase/glucosamine-1-phosphate N-acetyltransferase
MNIQAIIMAAGKGTRMKSRNPSVSKVAFDLLGTPLVGHVLNALKPLKLDHIYTIVGHGGETTEAIVKDASTVVWQREQKGTGHAVMQVAPFLEGKPGTTMIVSGDTPLITSETLQKLLDDHLANKQQLTILTSILEQPYGYGRMVREKGKLTAIVEEINASEAEKQVKEINTGFYVFDNESLFTYLKELPPNPKNGELNITYLVKMFIERGFKVGTTTVDTFEETLGTNDRYQLAEARKILQHRINKKHMLNGVTIDNPDNTFIGPDVIIGQDTVIQSGVYITGKTHIGANNFIGANTSLHNVTMGDDNHLQSSHLEDATLGHRNTVGPNAHIRGHSQVKDDCRIGNFVELKHAQLEQGVKAAHLSYLGDVSIGEHTNIGCGTIVANYDGKTKHHTTIGKNVFIGSGAILIAPITIADETLVAAGSTLDQDTNQFDLAIARSPQTNKPNYYQKWKKR